MYIFLDESGDLGFTARSSAWFLVTVVAIDDYRKLEKIIKHARMGLKKKYKRAFSELHAYHCDDVTRRRVLLQLTKLDVTILTVVLKKQGSPFHVRDQKEYLYRSVTEAVLKRFVTVDMMNRKSNVSIVIDKKDTNKRVQGELVSQIVGMLTRQKIAHHISLAASHHYTGLQVVDFVSWAIFRKYEHNDVRFYNVIRNKIKDEQLLIL
jgi:hypothetical protein